VTQHENLWLINLATGAERQLTDLTPDFDIRGDVFSINDRSVVNGVQTTLDQFRGTPFYRVDLRISRNIALNERITLRPFVEFVSLFNRRNPGTTVGIPFAAQLGLKLTF
jgi:hypothetical protein